MPLIFLTENRDGTIRVQEYRDDIKQHEKVK